jgi:hypothetical protein
MVDHCATWARIIEMARAHFPNDEGAAFAATWEAFDAEDTVAYAAN